MWDSTSQNRIIHLSPGLVQSCSASYFWLPSSSLWKVWLSCSRERRPCLHQLPRYVIMIRKESLLKMMAMLWLSQWLTLQRTLIIQIYLEENLANILMSLFLMTVSITWMENLGVGKYKYTDVNMKSYLWINITILLISSMQMMNISLICNVFRDSFTASINLR